MHIAKKFKCSCRSLTSIGKNVLFCLIKTIFDKSKMLQSIFCGPEKPSASGEAKFLNDFDEGRRIRTKPRSLISVAQCSTWALVSSKQDPVID